MGQKSDEVRKDGSLNSSGTMPSGVICLAFCTKSLRNAEKVISHHLMWALTSNGVSARVKWCERSHHMVWGDLERGLMGLASAGRWIWCVNKRRLNCKIPKKGAIESSYFYFPAWIIWYSANFISFNHNSILILALRPYVIQGRNALVMKWVSHAELQSFNTMRVITRAHYYAFRRDFTV